MANSISLSSSHPVLKQRRVIAFCILVLSIMMIWFSSWDHPLYPPDEGRYATVSLHMAQSGDWLVPSFKGKPHLTKPPLIYWAEAACIKLMGPTEAAVRLPSQIASTLFVLLLFFVGCRLGGITFGMISVCVFSIMPLGVVVDRLALTDPLLNLFWFGTLSFGYFAVSEKRTRFALLMWLSLALGLLTKGPLAFAPLVMVIAWVLFGRNRSSLRKLGLRYGLPLACIPLGVWVAAVMTLHSDALEIWRQEMLGRIGGSAEHSEPIWYYIPVFLAGLFPATIMLPIPGITIKWKRIGELIRASSPWVFWSFAAIVPLVLFSIMSGKLATYLLPVCGPWALISAYILQQWFTGNADKINKDKSLPEVKGTLSITLCIGLIAVIVGAIVLDVRLAWFSIPLGLAAICSIWVWSKWKTHTEFRLPGMAGIWLALLVTWFMAFEAEDIFWKDYNLEALVSKLHQIEDKTASEVPFTVNTYGFRDTTLDYYYLHDIARVYLKDINEVLTGKVTGKYILLVGQDDWEDLSTRNAKVAKRFKKIGQCNRWIKDQTLIFELQ